MTAAAAQIGLGRQARARLRLAASSEPMARCGADTLAVAHGGCDNAGKRTLAAQPPAALAFAGHDVASCADLPHLSTFLTRRQNVSKKADFFYMTGATC